MEHQQESKQEFGASSETSSASTIKTEPFSCPECSARLDPKRQWLLATSVLLNLMFTVASVTILIVLFAPLRSSSLSTNLPSSPSPPIHQNITTPHAHARRHSPITTCLLGITEADMYTFIDSIGSRSYPGQTCQQVNQEGLVPYQYGALYEVAVAPVGFPGARDIDKRSDFSNVNDDFGPGHAHWHPGTEEEEREIEDRTGRWPFLCDVLVLVSRTHLQLPTTSTSSSPPQAQRPHAIGSDVLVAVSVVLALVVCVHGREIRGQDAESRDELG